MKQIFAKYHYHSFAVRRIFCILFSVALMGIGGCQKKQPKPLDVLVPPSLNAVANELGAKFEQNYGIPVNVKPVDISYIDCEMHADIFFCNDPLKNKALDDSGCVADTLPLSYTYPVFVLPKDNPHNITSIDDLLSGNWNITIQGLSDNLRRQAARFFPEYDKWPEIEYEVSLTEELKKPLCDAVLTWKYIADIYGEQVTILPLSNHPDSTVQIDVLVMTHCKNIKAYHAFLDTLTSRSGRDILKKHYLPSLFR